MLYTELYVFNKIVIMIHLYSPCYNATPFSLIVICSASSIYDKKYYMIGSLVSITYSFILIFKFIEIVIFGILCVLYWYIIVFLPI